MFPDSDIAKKYGAMRTKSTAMIRGKFCTLKVQQFTSCNNLINLWCLRGYFISKAAVLLKEGGSLSKLILFQIFLEDNADILD